jgi:signal transduction histidine kinase
MSAQTRALGGMLQVASVAGKGTMVEAILP